MAEFKCRFCGDTFTSADLREFREMGEAYYKDKTAFVCPDCYDAFSRLTPEEQIKNLLDDATQRERSRRSR